MKKLEVYEHKAYEIPNNISIIFKRIDKNDSTLNLMNKSYNIRYDLIQLPKINEQFTISHKIDAL